MNLGQAVAVCLYELARGATPDESERTVDSSASAAELERLTVLLGEVLRETGYTRHHPANSDEAQVRRLVRRIGANAKDAPVWMGILRQVLWKVRSES